MILDIDNIGSYPREEVLSIAKTLEIAKSVGPFIWVPSYDGYAKTFNRVYNVSLRGFVFTKNSQ